MMALVVAVFPSAWVGISVCKYMGWPTPLALIPSALCLGMAWVMASKAEAINTDLDNIKPLTYPDKAIHRAPA